MSPSVRTAENAQHCASLVHPRPGCTGTPKPVCGGETGVQQRLFWQTSVGLQHKPTATTLCRALGTLGANTTSGVGCPDGLPLTGITGFAPASWWVAANSLVTLTNRGSFGSGFSSGSGSEIVTTSVAEYASR
jgi:hypothetical protein